MFNSNPQCQPNFTLEKQNYFIVIVLIISKQNYKYNIPISITINSIIQEFKDVISSLLKSIAQL
jgi:hypothetical protein